MRASLFLKIFLVLPAVLFADYILISIIGCTTCLFGADDAFYCGPFCLAGKIILGISALFFGYLLYPELRQLFSSKNMNTRLPRGQGRGSGPAYGRGLGPGQGRGLAPGGRRFVDADKNGICDMNETSVKKN